MPVRSVRHPDDLAALDVLFEDCRRHDGHHPLSEHKYWSLIARHLGGEGLIAEENGLPVGYAHVLRSQIEHVWELELAVEPHLRQTSVEIELIRAAIAHVRERGGTNLYAWVYTPGGEVPLSDLGFAPARELHQLRCPLPADPPQIPPGISVRGFEPSDERALLEVNNRAFRGHPESGNWTAADVRRRQQYDWYDPNGIRMAWEGDRLVALCWTKTHPGGVGEIYLIATDPEYQGRGIGRTVALEGLDYLSREKGSSTGMLYVDGANEAALKLYERMGFEVHHTDRAFGLVL